MLTRPRAGPAAAFGPGQTIRWLAWLARGMRDHGEAVFYLDWMQPSWLPTGRQRWLVMLAPALLVVALGGVVGAVDMLLTCTMIQGHPSLLTVMGNMDGGLHLAPPGSAAGVALAGAGVGLAAGLLAAVFTFERRIAPTNKLGWSWSTFARNLPTVLAAVVGAIVVTLVVDRFLSGLAVHLVYGLLLVVLFKAGGREADMNGRGRGPRGRAGLRRRPPERRARVAVVALVVAAVLAAGAAAAPAPGAPPRPLPY